MPEPVPTAPAEDISKATPAPAADAGKPAADAAGAASSKVADASAAPAEELKSLLDEASETGTDGAVKAVVPEKYEFKLPEGMIIDPEKLAVVEPVFKDLGLNNEQAQKLVDLQQKIVEASEAEHARQWDQYIEDRKKETRDFFGSKLPDVMRNVARARDQFVEKTLQEKINASGLSNDKDFIVFMDKIGRVVGEGSFVGGKRSSTPAGDARPQDKGEKAPTLEDIYPSMSKAGNQKIAFNGSLTKEHHYGSHYRYSQLANAIRRRTSFRSQRPNRKDG